MDIPEGLASKMFSEIRDSRRPSIDDVLEIVDSAFGKMNIAVRRITSGPPSWVWEDEETVAIGFPRYYVLSTSNSDGVEGYPLFTVRQAYSIRFDTWVTVSALVIGPDPEAIARSVSLILAHHAGAFAGMKFVVSTISANRSSPLAGMVAVQKLLESPPLSVESDAEEGLVERFIGGEKDDREPFLDTGLDVPDPKLVN